MCRPIQIRGVFLCVKCAYSLLRLMCVHGILLSSSLRKLLLYNYPAKSLACISFQGRAFCIAPAKPHRVLGHSLNKRHGYPNAMLAWTIGPTCYACKDNSQPTFCGPERACVACLILARVFICPHIKQTKQGLRRASAWLCVGEDLRRASRYTPMPCGSFLSSAAAGQARFSVFFVFVFVFSASVRLCNGSGE